jgi:chromosome segregation ATPase
LNNTISELNGQISGFEQKIEEGNNTIATLTTERDTANENYANAQAEVTTLTEENEGLKTYKLNIENNEKLAVIAAYDNKLSDDVLESYRGRVSEFSLDELKKDLAFNFIETNPSIFSNQSQPQYVPKDNVVTGGIEEVLAKYKK